MPLSNPPTIGTIGVTYDAGGATLVSTGNTITYIYCPFNGTITNWSIFGDVVGSIVIDVWMVPYANFPPSSSNSITNGNYPTLSSVQNNTATTTNWSNTSIINGNIIAFQIISTSTVSRVNLSLTVQKT